MATSGNELSHSTYGRLKPSTSSRTRSGGSRRASKAKRRGTAALEFAVVSPVIFLLFFASIEFGRLLMVTHGLESAASEGCRAAIARDATEQGIEAAVDGQLAAFGISDCTLTTDPSPAGSASQWQPITVRTEVLYDDVSWLPLPRYLKGITLRGSSTLTQERDPGNS